MSLLKLNRKVVDLLIFVFFNGIDARRSYTKKLSAHWLASALIKEGEVEKILCAGSESKVSVDASL